MHEIGKIVKAFVVGHPGAGCCQMRNSRAAGVLRQPGAMGVGISGKLWWENGD